MAVRLNRLFQFSCFCGRVHEALVDQRRKADDLHLRSLVLTGSCATFSSEAFRIGEGATSLANPFPSEWKLVSPWLQIRDLAQAKASQMYCA